MSTDAEERVICEGEWGTVEYAVRAHGSLPAKRGLDDIKKKDKENYRRLQVLFMRIAKIGSGSLSTGIFGHLEDEIFEFKRHPYRVACFFKDNRCLLTHVFAKKSGRAYVSEQIKKARKIMNEHIKGERN